MGFRIITGTMGGGKSYYATEEMLRAIREGAIVHTNLEIVPHEWAKICEADDQIVELTDDFTQWKSQIRPGAEGAENVVIVDEGALIFNAQDFASAKAEKRAVFEFMVHSRHLGLDVIFISQHAKNIDAQLRRMTQSIMVCVKAEEVRPYGFIFGKVFGDFRRHLMDPTGRVEWDATWARFSPEIGKLYRTHMTKGRMSGVERDVRRVAKEDTSKTRVKRAAVVLACVVLAIVGGIFSLGSKVYGKIANSHADAPADEAEVPKPAPSPAAAQPVAPARPAADPSPVKEPRFLPRFGCGRDHRGRYYVDLADGTAMVGEVYRDAIVAAVSHRGSIIELHLDDGRTLRTRPATSGESRKPSQSTKPKMPWLSSPLPSFSF